MKGGDPYHEKDEIGALMVTNDDKGSPMPERKAQIKTLFNKIGLNPIWKPQAPKAFRESVKNVVNGIV